MYLRSELPDHTLRILIYPSHLTRHKLGSVEDIDKGLFVEGLGKERDFVKNQAQLTILASGLFLSHGVAIGACNQVTTML